MNFIDQPAPRSPRPVAFPPNQDRGRLVRLASLVMIGSLGGLLVACVEDGSDSNEALLASADDPEFAQDELAPDDLMPPAVQTRTTTTATEPGQEVFPALDPVSVAATATLQVRARKGVYWKYCTVSAPAVGYNGSGQLTFNAKVSCDSTMTNIGLKAYTYKKTTSSGSSSYHHGTDGGTLSNKSTRTVQDLSLCARRNQNWWAGVSVFSIKFPDQWYPLAENGITTSGTTATGSLSGPYTAYYCSTT